MIMNYTVEYFHARIKEEIESWPDDILADFAHIIELLIETGINLQMPYSRAMGGGLFEFRPRSREGIGRVFYCYIANQQIMILHAFLKKTSKTPACELQIAKRRLKVVKNA